MESLSRKRLYQTAIFALLWGVSATCYGGPPNKKEVAVIDLGEPGVKYSYFQETGELGDKKMQSVTWLGPGSEDAFLVIDTSVLEANDWALEHPKTGARLKGHVLLRTHVAVRKPSENRRTYKSLFGMLHAFDDNGDKRLDASDFIYRALGVYRDGNKDGVVDPGEVSSLGDAGITELVLVVKGKRQRDEHGNLYQSIDVKKQDGSMTQAHLVRLKSR